MGANRLNPAGSPPLTYSITATQNRLHVRTGKAASGLTMPTARDAQTAPHYKVPPRASNFRLQSIGKERSGLFISMPSLQRYPD